MKIITICRAPGFWYKNNAESLAMHASVTQVLTSIGISSATFPSKVNIFCNDAAAVWSTCFTTSLGRNLVASNFITPIENQRVGGVGRNLNDLTRNGVGEISNLTQPWKDQECHL